MGSNDQPVSAMDVERVLNMNGGLGEASYSQNCSVQKNGMDTVRHVVITSAMNSFVSNAPKVVHMADLGCSTGLNALSTAQRIIEAICRRCHEAAHPVPDFMVFLNDLSTNDFNTMFGNTREFVKKIKDCDGEDETRTTPSVFVAGVPGSFYGRLFPDNSLNFVCSSYSLHWLSQAPRGLFDEQGKAINKGKVYISHTSPASVVQSYLEQFRTDFSLFLESRSKELCSGGRMAFALSGRDTDEFDRSKMILWELLAQSFAILVSQDLVKDETVSSYNVPFYAPSIKEIENEVKKEGSFAMEHVQAFDMSISTGNIDKDATMISMSVRVVQESMITHHFGEGIVETLFQVYKELLREALMDEEIKDTLLVIALKKL